MSIIVFIAIVGLLIPHYLKAQASHTEKSLSEPLGLLSLFMKSRPLFARLS
jgi:hypothetical protein